MNVSFPNAPRVDTVWLPQLTPTHATVLNTVIGLALAAIFCTAVIVILMVICFEKPFSWVRSAATLAVIGLGFAGLGVATNRVSGTHEVFGATPAASRADALDAAAQSATPRDAWKLSTKEISSSGQKVQTGWTAKDRIVISQAAAKMEGLTAPHSTTAATLDSAKGMDTGSIALYGTSYTKAGKAVRCVVRLRAVVRNNVGQPVSAQIEKVRCADAAATPTHKA